MGATVRQGHVFFSTMHSEGLAGKTETFLRVGVTPRLEAGFGYLHHQGIARPLASYTLVTESAARPSVTTGLMYDSLGGGRQGVFLSLAKGVRTPLGIAASVYVGGAKITNENNARLIAGANVPLSRRVSASVQFDGRYANLGLTGQVGSISGVPIRLGIVAARGDQFGPLMAVSAPMAR